MMNLITESTTKAVFTVFRARHPELREGAASEIYRKSVRLLENLVHYRAGSHLSDDIVTTMEVIYSEMPS